MIIMANVRIDDEDNQLLEQIRAYYILKGKKKTKKGIMKELIRKKASEVTDIKLISKTVETPLEEDITWILLNKPLSWGIKDTSTTVDQHLYK